MSAQLNAATLHATLAPHEALQAVITPNETLRATLTQGPMMVSSCPDYEGEYIIRPAVHEQEMETENRRMKENLIVQEIPYMEVTNASGSTTVIIG